jgi:hypothetical protein
VNRLQISTVTPNRRYAIDVIDPTNSGPERVTFYSGIVTVVGNPGFRGIIRGTDVEQLAFFVPDRPPLTSIPRLLEVEMSVRSYRASTGDAGGTFVVGAVQPRVALAPDSEGSGPWLQVSFGMHPAGSDGCELNFRIAAWGLF